MFVLFITEKYLIAENKNFGLTNNMYNLIGSFECSSLGNYKHLFISEDPGDLWSPESIDKALLNEKYDIAVISPYFLQNCNPQTASKLKKKLVFCWWDAVAYSKENQNLNKYCHWWNYGDRGAINLIFDHGVGEIHKNCHAVAVPQDTRLFKSESYTEDIDVSFIGAYETRGDRKQVVEMIRGAGINCWAGGGRGPNGNHSNFSMEEYVSIHQRSKICLNLQFGHGQPQRKGRSFELAACGKFMLSNNPHVFHNFFVDGEDYVSFDNGNLIDKIRHYLNNKEEREGYKERILDKYRKLYSPVPFWSNVVKFTQS